MHANMDEKQKEQLKFDLAELVVDSLKKHQLDLDAARDVSEYILDTLDFLDTHVDALEFLVELHTDWNIASEKLSSLLKKYMNFVQKSYAQTNTEERSQLAHIEDKLDTIKNKLAQIAQ